jgi:4-hydroxy-tetrahydrodipicolinate reductase
MGREIMELAAADQTTVPVEIVAQIDRFLDWKTVPADKVDLVIDFSNPKGSGQALRWALENLKPIVSGTTGLSKLELREFTKAAKKIPVLYSANMSLGVAVMSAMIQSFRAVPDWNFQIDEVHHIHKKDRPSGTALLLQTALVKAVGRKLPEPNSIRGGGVPGIHRVWAMGPEENLILEHTAFKRAVFARGALAATRWLFDKNEPGLYDLSHLYSLN